jgi:hypothetical protein
MKDCDLESNLIGIITGLATGRATGPFPSGPLTSVSGALNARASMCGMSAFESGRRNEVRNSWGGDLRTLIGCVESNLTRSSDRPFLLLTPETTYRYDELPTPHRLPCRRQELPESRHGRPCSCATLDTCLRWTVRRDFRVSFPVQGANRSLETSGRFYLRGKRCPSPAPKRPLPSRPGRSRLVVWNTG